MVGHVQGHLKAVDDYEEEPETEEKCEECQRKVSECTCDDMEYVDAAEYINTLEFKLRLVRAQRNLYRDLLDSMTDDD